MDLIVVISEYEDHYDLIVSVDTVVIAKTPCANPEDGIALAQKAFDAYKRIMDLEFPVKAARQYEFVLEAAQTRGKHR